MSVVKFFQTLKNLGLSSKIYPNDIFIGLHNNNSFSIEMAWLCGVYYLFYSVNTNKTHSFSVKNGLVCKRTRI